MKQSAIKTYRVLSADKLDSMAESYILTNIYKELCERLFDAGYGSEQIRKALISHAKYIKQIKETARDNFISNVITRKVQDNPIKSDISKEKYLECLRMVNLSALISLYEQIDTETLSEMLDIGYTEREINEAYQHNNLYSDIIQDLTLQEFYEQGVYALFRSKREEIIVQQIEEGTTEYLRLIKSVPAGPEQDTAEDEYNIFREGNAIISLMLTKRLSPETIKEILINNSPYPGKNREIYFQKLVDQCQDVKRAYLKIKSASPNYEDAQSVVDIYRSFAKNYMKENDLYLLNYENDYEILEALRENLIPDEHLKPAFAEGSPVAIQPGRNKDEYISCLFSAGRGDKDKAYETSNSNFILTATDYYRDLAEKADRELKITGVTEGINKSRNYYDCLIAYKLVKENHFSFKDIKKVIENNSYSSSNNPARAEIIINSAADIITQEQNLLKLPDRPINIEKGTSYREAIEKYSPKEIFKFVLYEHIALNPSIKNRLLNRNVNVDLAESVLYQFPDFDIDVLKKILETDTPFGILVHHSILPDDRNYGDETIKQAKDRLEKDSIITDRENKLISSYSTSYLESGQGIPAFSFNSVCFRQGQSALKELNRGMNIYDIKRGIIETAERKLIPMPIEEFADDIIKKIQSVRERMIVLQNVPTISDPRTGELLYKETMRSYFSKNNRFTKQADILAAQKLLNENYPKTEIIRILNDLSPFAEFPGHTDRYAVSVLQTAENTYKQELSKLKELALAPRQEIEDAPEEAYAYWLNQIQHRINLNHDLRMDEAIVQVMLLEGFTKKDIIGAVQQLSPSKNLQDSYSENLVRRVVYYLLTKAPETPEVINFRNYKDHQSGVNEPIRETNQDERELEYALERKVSNNKNGTV